jgi:hypothetical protein
MRHVGVVEGRSTKSLERPRETARPASGEGDLLDLMEQTKPMVAEHGADTSDRIVDLLG